MAITVQQGAFATNTLAQTFSVVLTDTPVEGAPLVAFLWHDELTVVDAADITSAGWVRMNTHLFPFGAGVDFRTSVWAKFAGAAETKTTAFDLGEVNRRAHGFVIEFTGATFTLLPAEDTASKVTHENTVAGATNTVDSALAIPAPLMAVSLVGLTGTMTIDSFAFDSGLTKIGDANSNFRGTGLAFLEGADTQTPTATWTGNRTNGQMFVLIGANVDVVPFGSSLVM